MRQSARRGRSDKDDCHGETRAKQRGCPGDEDVAARLMHLQWSAGNREDAVKTYQRVVGYLNHTLAIGPSHRLKTLYQALCNGDEAPPFKGAR